MFSTGLLKKNTVLNTNCNGLPLAPMIKFYPTLLVRSSDFSITPEMVSTSTTKATPRAIESAVKNDANRR